MKKFYETRQFLKVLDKWYKKLEKVGFEDAEYLDDNNQPTCFLSSTGNTIGRSSTEPTIREDVLEYYQLCTHWQHHITKHDMKPLLTKKVSEDVVKKIWSLYCDGLPYAKIYTALNKKKKTVGLKKIKKIVKHMEAQCFIWRKSSSLLDF